MITTDEQLLQQYARDRSESAFGELVTRHLDYVYSDALRVVNGDAPLAQDVTQTVFFDLARQAGKLSCDVALAGWLHRHTCYTAAKAVRTERRRQSREHTAMEMRALDDNTRPEWELVAPYLDESLNELDPKDRDALVLRYLRKQNLRAVGATLGISEDAAQKRVDRALEKLHVLLKHRGATLSLAALGTALASQAVTAAPVGLAAAITSAALSGTTIATTAINAATKTITMTTLQKAGITAAFVATAVMGIYEVRQVSGQRAELNTLKQQQRPLVQQLQEKTRERDDLANKLDALRNDNARLNRNTAELLSLRGEVARLRSESRLLHPANSIDPSTDTYAKHWLARVNQLKAYVEKNPAEQIPEFQFLTDREWLAAAEVDLKTELFEKDDDFRRAMDLIGIHAESRFSTLVQAALNKYSLANNGQFPAQFSLLGPFCDPAVVEMLEQLYEIKPGDILTASVVKDFNLKVDWVVTRKQPVNSNSTSRLATFSHGSAYWQSPL